MSDEVTFKWNRSALRDLRYGDTDQRVRTLLENMGQSIMDRANDTLEEGVGYRMSSQPGKRAPYGRWQVRVYTASNHAKRSDAIHNTLRKMLG